MFGLFVSEKGISIIEGRDPIAPELAESPHGNQDKFQLIAAGALILDDEPKTFMTYEQVPLQEWARGLRPDPSEVQSDSRKIQEGCE